MTSSDRLYEFDLPPDFISFIQSNYEKIFAIRQKIKEFHEQSRDKEFFRKRRSASDLSSDTEETSPIIRAKIKFKPHLLQKLDTVEIGSDYLSQWQRGSSTETEEENISRKFPSLVLSPGANRREWGSHETSLLVEGMSIKLVSRVEGKPNVKKYLYHPRPSLKRTPRFQTPRKTFKRLMMDHHTLGSSEERRFPFLPSLHEIAWDIYNRYTTDENVDSFPQLIFPPLHASVLALLSQRSTSGNQLRKVGTGQQGFGVSATKQKLRRHGRRRKNGSQEKLGPDECTEGDQQERPATDGGEDPEQPDGKEETPAGSNPENNGDEDLLSVTGRGRQLYQILDETLSRTRWYLTQKKMTNEIRELEKVLGKNDRRMENRNMSHDLESLSLLPNPRKKRLNSLCQPNQVS